jgi:hypothetical protein
MGGIGVEIEPDVALAPAPLSQEAAVELIDQLRMRALLKSVRGKASADVPALIDLLMRISVLIVEQDGIDILELNPVIVHPLGQGISIADALMIVR